MTTSRIGEPLHFKKADLIEAAGEDVNDVTVVRDSFREVVIELLKSVKVP